jgi:2-polyprenyl-3-methyl-5-hydroxy-6-metoxy-1,4-benzoquinol methylase
MNNGADQAEQERIKHVYGQWRGAALARYAWHRPDILLQNAQRARTVAALLTSTVGTDLSSLRVLDVGCGSGGFVRQLIEWGATPGHLTGTEFQSDRLDLARARTVFPTTAWTSSVPTRYSRRSWTTNCGANWRPRCGACCARAAGR